ncbi:hypothetical protein J6590_010081 [Homalodisca vitripennis]|nr:hypothetical protein J6590_010081 [Homalodisca vitripennis]
MVLAGFTDSEEASQLARIGAFTHLIESAPGCGLSTVFYKGNEDKIDRQTLHNCKAGQGGRPGRSVAPRRLRDRDLTIFSRPPAIVL